MRWFCGVTLDCGDDTWCLAIQRSIDEGPFTPDEVRRLARASKGFGSAAAVARALGFARCEAVLDLMESTASPVVLLDRSGSVFSISPSAEKLLSQDLMIVARRLVSIDRDFTNNLEKALRTLLWNPEPNSLVPPVPLPRRDGRRPILAYPMRLPSLSANQLSPAQAILVLRDLEAAQHAGSAEIQSVFGLTPAESRIASLLSEGRSVDDISVELTISILTCRTHIRSIFWKTGTRRQAELVSLLSRFLQRTQ